MKSSLRSLTFTLLFKVLHKLAVKNRLKTQSNLNIASVFIASFFLVGCGPVTFQYYTPVGDVSIDSGFRSEVPITDGLRLRSYVLCDPVFYSLDIYRQQKYPEFCEVTIMLFGQASESFDFTNTVPVLRDGNDHSMHYDRRNTRIMEGGREQFRLLDDLPGHYDYLRGLEVGFWLEHRPTLLELVVPDLMIDGVIYQVPVLQFEYSRDTEMRYFTP